MLLIGSKPLDDQSVFFPGQDYSCCSHHPLVAFRSLSGVEAFWTPFTLATLACLLSSDQLMFWQSLWWYLWVLLLTFQEDTPSQQTFCSSGSHSIPTPLPQWSLGLRSQNYVVSIGTELHNFTFWFLMIFSNGRHLLQKDVSLIKGKYCTYLDIRINIQTRVRHALV